MRRARSSERRQPRIAFSIGWPIPRSVARESAAMSSASRTPFSGGFIPSGYALPVAGRSAYHGGSGLRPAGLLSEDVQGLAQRLGQLFAAYQSQHRAEDVALEATRLAVVKHLDVATTLRSRGSAQLPDASWLEDVGVLDLCADDVGLRRVVGLAGPDAAHDGRPFGPICRRGRAGVHSVHLRVDHGPVVRPPL